MQEPTKARKRTGSLRDLVVGEKFGRGTVTEYPHWVIRPSGKDRGAVLRCECGTEYETTVASLLYGNCQSCGCLRRERHLAAITKHGMFHHPLYRTWDGMVRRTTNPRDPSYEAYGGRGITVCDEWRDVRTFVADIERLLGRRPDGCTLDRIDNDAGYMPGNVRWATPEEQAANQRTAAPRGYGTYRRAPRLKPPAVLTCAQCGVTFEGRANAKAARRFCSNLCKAAWRRATGADDVTKDCHVCGTPFTRNRYDQIAHCSQSCAATCQHSGGCAP